MTGRAPSNNANNAGCLLPMGVLFTLAGIVFGGAALLGTKGYQDPSQKMTGGAVALAVACIGVGLIVAGRSATTTAKQAQATAGASPGKPWLWRDDWAQGYARPDWQSEAATRGAIGLLLLVVSSASLAGVILHPPRHRSYMELLVLVLPLGGLILIGQSILIRLRERKFRQVRLALSTLPGVLGGRLRGQLESAFAFPAGCDVLITLSCVRSYVSGSGDGRSRWENVLWQARQAITPFVGGPGTSAPIDFTIPCDARETDASNPADEIFWRLTANAALAGLDFRASFKVPVFKTEASDASLTTEVLEAGEVAHLAGQKPPDAKIATGTSGEGGVRFHLGPARNKGVAAALTLFGSIFLGAGIFWGRLVSGSFTWFAGAIPLLFSGGTGLMLILFALGLWFGQTDMSVRGRSLRIRSSCLGFSRERSVNAAEIQKFELYPAMKSGDHVWYDLRLHLSHGGKVTAGSGLEKSEAEWFLGELKKDLGI
ncbi:MAG: hypothetical protein LAP39_22375 [Acidobacteriia bacterium]|nr:hypothetical protein [Terriglobia bacterium]